VPFYSQLGESISSAARPGDVLRWATQEGFQPLATPSLSVRRPHTIPGTIGIFNFGHYIGRTRHVKRRTNEWTLKYIDESPGDAENTCHATGLFMQKPRSLLAVLALLLFLLLFLAWLLLRRIDSGRPDDSMPPEAIGVELAETRVTATLSAEILQPSSPVASLAPPLITSPTMVVTSLPEHSPVRTQAATSTAPPEPSPTVTATPPWSITATAMAHAESVDRSCPNPSPAKPDYLHYYLSGDKWQEPDDEVGEHFWMSKPLPGGGRLLITDWLPYGYDAGGRYLLHNGVDAAEPEGTPLLAAADGLVVVAGDDQTALYGWRCDWYGHLVVIELDEKWQDQPVYALYGHVLNIKVQPGQRVSRGETIAEVGVGGAATLPHLHFEVRVGSNEFSSTRNPLLWIEPPNSRGIVAGRLVDPDGRPWQGVAINVVGRSEGTEGTTTWTYLSDPEPMVNADEGLAENFAVADLIPGQYELITALQGQEYRAIVEVEAGRLSTIEIITEAFRMPTPEVEPISPDGDVG
jgi:murein DD-endopeptidase MepM/ murein hydrolase activator NlpD